MSKVILITGAGRGLGADIARRALDTGHQVIATARDAGKVREALGDRENLLAASLDITDPGQAETVVAGGLEKFGSIDVLINNAAILQAGYFEEISDRTMRDQIDTNLFGPMNVTRAVLPQMRQQRSGHIISSARSSLPRTPTPSSVSRVGWRRCTLI